MNPELSRIVIAQRTGQLLAEAETLRIAREARRARRARRAESRQFRQHAALAECVPTANN